MRLSDSIVISVLLILKFGLTNSLFLNSVSDEELVETLRNEQYVLVLFTKDNCEECEQFEDILLRIREELLDSIHLSLVKAVNSQLVRLYNPNKEPSLVFFRHGIPLLYNGSPDGNLILHTLTENKQPCVRELSDDTFEHLTQAATGATTGDWFIFFQSTDCVDCQRLRARLEAVCADLKTRLNVASINRDTAGKTIFKRFEVTSVPSFIFFRLGKMYKYTTSKYDINSLRKFALEDYKKTRFEPVPPPQSFQIAKILYALVDFVFQGGFMGKIYWLIFLSASLYYAVKRINRLKGKKNKDKSSNDDGKKSS